MKKMIQKSLSILLCGVILCVGLTGCGAKKAADKPAEVNIAYQYGLAYAPLVIAKDQGLIEKAYEKATGKKATVTWNQMSSGPDINTAFASGSINVGFMGVAPAITGVSKKVGYKIFTNLSGQEHGLMTNQEDISSLDDLVGSDKQIALVNIGSIQHIILGMALVEAGYDAHSLDSNIVAMKHPDGMSSLMSNSIPCHLTTNPYLYKERESDELNELDEVSNLWGSDTSFIVGIASESLQKENPELYKAVCDAIAEAIEYVNNNPEATAAITCELNNNTPEEELRYLQEGNYGAETSGIYELATFMSDNGFIENSFASYSDLVFDNVKGD